MLSLGLNIWRCISSGGATLAPGALGVWYADQYQASPRKAIPNSASSAALSQNLFTAPRRLFAVTNLWVDAFGGMTITDDAAIASDGSLTASILIMPAGKIFNTASGNILPAGTYTWRATLKSNSGSNEFFRVSKDSLVTFSSVMTVTTAWLPFSYTFTLAAPSDASNIRLCTKDGATAANLQVEDISLYAGSSDLGANTYDGHMYLGVGQYDTAPSCSAGELTLTTANAFGLVQLPSNVAFGGGFTVQVTAKKVATTQTNQPFFSSVKAPTTFTAALERNSRISCGDINGATQNFIQAVSDGLWTLNGAGYHVFTIRSDGTTLTMWVDDVKLFSDTFALSAFNVRDLFVGILGTAGLSCDLKINSQALYSSALTDAQVRANVAHFQARLAASGYSIGTVDYLVYEGDSLSVLEPYSFPWKSTFTRPTFGVNLAISGSTTADLVSRVARVNDIVPPTPGSRRFILGVLIGANDALALGASTFLTGYDSYLNTSVTAPYNKKVVRTITPRTTGGFNAVRNTINATLVTWPGLGKCTAISDFAANATIGPDAAASDVAKYYDGTHATASTQVIMASIDVAAINAL